MTRDLTFQLKPFLDSGRRNVPNRNIDATEKIVLTSGPSWLRHLWLKIGFGDVFLGGVGSNPGATAMIP